MSIFVYSNRIDYIYNRIITNSQYFGLYQRWAQSIWFNLNTSPNKSQIHTTSLIRPVLRVLSPPSIQSKSLFTFALIYNYILHAHMGGLAEN